MMTPGTVVLDLERLFAVVTSSAILPGVQFIHGYLDGSLLHLGKEFRIVAVGTLQPGVLVNRSVEYNLTHIASVEFKSLPRTYRKSIPACQERHNQAYCRYFPF